MANIAKFNSRVVMKHDTEANWNTAGNNNFIPLLGEIIVYDSDNSYSYERFKIGDGVTQVHKLPFVSSIEDVTELPTTNIHSGITYRVLQGTFIVNALPQPTGKCHIVAWNSTPTTAGEDVFTIDGDNFIFCGYYNINDGTLYGYFSSSCVDKLNQMIANSDWSSTEKWLAQQALKLVSKNTWYTLERIIEIAGSLADDMSWGGIITNMNQITSSNALYLYLQSSLFFYHRGSWVGLNTNGIKSGTGAGSEIFNCLNNIASGESSHAEGDSTTALGDASHAEGRGSQAKALVSHAEGSGTITEGVASHAEGSGTYTLGMYSHAEGNGTKALGQSAHAEGSLTIADAHGSHAEGTSIQQSNSSALESRYVVVKKDQDPQEIKASAAYGRGAHAEGAQTFALGYASHSEGFITDATGAYAHAEGDHTVASGAAAHAEGVQTLASSSGAHAEGEYARAESGGAHAEGSFAEKDELGNLVPRTTFHYKSHREVVIEGGSVAYNRGAHAEGLRTFAGHEGAHAEGGDTDAVGLVSHAEGAATIAKGEASHAEGYLAKAFGDGSHAEGYYATDNMGQVSERTVTRYEGVEDEEGETITITGGSLAYGIGSHAEGIRTFASHKAAHSEGMDTDAMGEASHAEGYWTVASKNYAHAEGMDTAAKGVASHAEGDCTTALGYASHAEGQDTSAYAIYSHAEGFETIVGQDDNTDIGAYGHAEGTDTVVLGKAGHAEGQSSRAEKQAAHAEGMNTMANGIAAHAEGKYTWADSEGAHVEGSYVADNQDKPVTRTTKYYKSNPNGVNIDIKGGSLAGNKGSHAEGIRTFAGHEAAHSEGYDTDAVGHASHAEGTQTIAKGAYSHAEGSNTEALSEASHAEGKYTRADSEGAHAEGSYVADADKKPVIRTTKYYKSNPDGVDVDVKGGSLAYNKGSHAEGMRTFAGHEAAHSEGIDTDAVGKASHAEGECTLAKGEKSHAEGYHTEALGGAAHSEGTNTHAINNYSHAEGGYAMAAGEYSHAEGLRTYADANGSHAEGTAIDENAQEIERTVTLPNNKVITVQGPNAWGRGAHAEGAATVAYGHASHAEGRDTETRANYAHSEGQSTKASGLASHAEGRDSIASGNYSHAGGKGTAAKEEAQTTIGKYNADESTALFVVGAGASNNNRKNCFTTGNDGTNNYLKVGNVKLTEAQLQKILNFIDSIEEG